MSWNPSSLRAEIEKLGFELLEEGLVVATRPIVLRTNGAGTIVGWAGNEDNPAPSADFASLADYYFAVSGGEYSLMLFDGSLIQLSYEFRNKNLRKHRLCYLPCPMVLSRADFDADADPIGILEVAAQVPIVGAQSPSHGGQSDITPFDTQTVARETQDNEKWARIGRKLRLRPPMRFDYDLDAAAEHHPASHLHIALDDCRIPVFGPISVGHFVRFVFRHFYNSVWHAKSMLRTWPLGFGDRTVTSVESCEPFVECAQRRGGPLPSARSRRRSSAAAR